MTPLKHVRTLFAAATVLLFLMPTASATEALGFSAEATCRSLSHAEAHATSYNYQGTSAASAATSQQQSKDTGSWYADAVADGGTGATAHAQAGPLASDCTAKSSDLASVVTCVTHEVAVQIGKLDTC